MITIFSKNIENRDGRRAIVWMSMVKYERGPKEEENLGICLGRDKC